MLKHKNRGFTLIELMIVVAIIGLLASIAIPAMYHFRQKAFEDTLLNDVRNSGTIEEALFAETQAYVPFGPVTGAPGTTSLLIAPNTTIKISQNVTIQATLNNGTLTISATHPGATDPIAYSTAIGAVQ